MKTWVKIVVTIVVALVLLLAIGPFLVPIPSLEDTVPPQTLADPDSRFVKVEGVTLHVKTEGEGTPPLVLLHGFGASIYSWREVMSSLAEDARVVAFDRPAFGLTERPLPDEPAWPGYNPYTDEAQVELTVGLMDELGISKAVLVGNSAGGTVAAETALAYPDRVRALVLVDAAIFTGGGSPAWIRPLFNTPQMRRLGPLLARSIQSWGRDFGRSAWHDPSKIPPDYWEHYERPLQVEHWDRALWQLTRSSRPSAVSDRLSELTMPVLVITGDDDQIVPMEQSVRLAESLPNAELVVIPQCGHVPQEECPDAWLAAVEGFLVDLPEE